MRIQQPIILSLALGSGWLLSPESLVVAGNSGGQMTWLALPLLAVVALPFGLTARLLQHPELSSEEGSSFSLLAKLTGNIPAAALTISSSLPLIVLGATALLVTSGYTFNEVFLYWFPNFGFAFLLLALLTILQFCPEKIINRVQICFVALAMMAALFSLFISSTEQVTILIFSCSMLVISTLLATICLALNKRLESSHIKHPGKWRTPYEKTHSFPHIPPTRLWPARFCRRCPHHK